MDTVLFQKLMNKGNESMLESLKFAVLPIAKVFTMFFLGFLMASKYVNVLTTNGRKLLNGLVFSLLLPCLIFSQLSRAVTVQKMLEWWFIPANVVLGTIAGSLIGLLVAVVIRPPYPYFKFTIIQIGIGRPLDNITAPEAGKHTAKVTEKNPAPEAVPLLLPLVSDAVAPRKYTKKEKIVNFLSFMVEKLKINQIMQPPIIASIMAILIGAIPVFKNLIYR